MQGNICLICKHYTGKFKCKAFPDGIPDKIALGKTEHDKPLPIQENEIVFEEKETKGLEAIDYEKPL